MQIITQSRTAADALPESIMRALPYRLSDEIRRTSHARSIEEIRMRAGRRSSLVVSGRNLMLETVLDKDELEDVLEGMCQGDRKSVV